VYPVVHLPCTLGCVHGKVTQGEKKREKSQLHLKMDGCSLLPKRELLLLLTLLLLLLLKERVKKSPFFS